MTLTSDRMPRGGCRSGRPRRCRCSRRRAGRRPGRRVQLSWPLQAPSELPSSSTASRASASSCRSAAEAAVLRGGRCSARSPDAVAGRSPPPQPPTVSHQLTGVIADVAGGRADRVGADAARARRSCWCRLRSMTVTSGPAVGLPASRVERRDAAATSSRASAARNAESTRRCALRENESVRHPSPLCRASGSPGGQCVGCWWPAPRRGRSPAGGRVLSPGRLSSSARAASSLPIAIQVCARRTCRSASRGDATIASR